MQSKPLHIAPFTVDIADEVPSDLRARISNMRWPDRAPGDTWAQGTDLDDLKRLLHEWGISFDWRRRSAG